MQTPPVNPYAPPQAELAVAAAPAAQDQPLAGAAIRFAAKFIDLLLLLGASTVGPLVGSRAFPSNLRSEAVEAFFAFEWVVIVVPAGLLCLFQWYLIATTGQSLGKRWCGIKIVKTDGTRSDFVSGVLLRAWLPFLLSLFPGLGGLFSLIDALSVFRDDRRCLHDQFAGTKVIESR